jgi:hypothetical protein
MFAGETDDVSGEVWTWFMILGWKAKRTLPFGSGGEGVGTLHSIKDQESRLKLGPSERFAPGKTSQSILIPTSLEKFEKVYRPSMVLSDGL